ncbi:iron ABC transporter permease [bacterium]|nr:MAG: iron ABC transporter permease [bacterium]
MAADVRRLVPRARAVTFDASLLLWIAAAAVLIFMVVVPLLWLVYTSIQPESGRGLTFANYLTVFTQRFYLEPIRNSMILALSVALIAAAVGTPLAWLVTRSDMPARGLVRALTFAAFATPPFLGAQAWIFLAADRSGWLNRFWENLFHTQSGPFNIYTLGGAIFVMGLYSIPYTFTFVSGALEMMSSEMEDAAAVLGAGPWRTALQITLPLAAPAIVSGFIMSFLEGLALFGVPAFLLIPARQQVITTQLYEFFQFPVHVQWAAAYAMPLLTVTILLLVLQRRVLGRRQYTTVTGKGGRRRPCRLGRGRWPVLGLALIPSMLAILLPYAALFAVSISRAWGRGPVPGNLTLHWYRWALIDNLETKSAIFHSLGYGAAAATISVVIAVLIAYAVLRKLIAGAQLLGFLCMAPFVVPGIVLAIGFFSAYAHPPILLYGTAGMLIAAFATRFLPIAYSNSTSILRGINPELENAARTLGAGRLRTLSFVTAPLLRRGLLSGWLLVFIPAIRELSCAVFLFTPHTAVMTTLMFDFSDAGNYEALSTLGIVLMTITFAITIIAYRFLGRDFMQSREAAG